MKKYYLFLFFMYVYMTLSGCSKNSSSQQSLVQTDSNPEYLDNVVLLTAKSTYKVDSLKIDGISPKTSSPKR